METDESPIPFVETAEVHRSQMDDHSTFKVAMPGEEMAENGKEGFEAQEITNGDEEHSDEKEPFVAQPERVEADESNAYTEDNSHNQSKELPDSTSNDDVTETKAKIESTTGEEPEPEEEEEEEVENDKTDVKINNDKGISRLEEDEQVPDEMAQEDNVGTKEEVKMEVETKEETEKEKEDDAKEAPEAVKTEAKEVKGKAAGKPEKNAPKPRKRKTKGDGPTGPTRNPALCVPAAEVPTPKGWSRIVVQRITGASAGKYDVYYFSPFGKKLRSKNEVRNYCEQQNLVVDLDMFQFSHSLTPRRRGPKAAGPAAAKKPKAPAAGKKRKLAEGKNRDGKSNVSGVKGRAGAAKGKGAAAKGKVVAAKVKASVAKGKAAAKKGKAQGGAGGKGKPAQGKKTAKQRVKPAKSKDVKVNKATNKKVTTTRNTRESQTRASKGSKASQKVTVKFTFRAQKRQAAGQGQGSPDKRRK